MNGTLNTLRDGPDDQQKARQSCGRRRLPHSSIRKIYSWTDNPLHEHLQSSMKCPYQRCSPDLYTLVTM